MLNGITPLLGLGLVAAGGAKLDAPARFAETFAELGLPGWVVPWSGWGEVVLGLLLFYAPTRRFGAVGLTGWMLVATLLQARAGSVDGALVASVVLVVAMLVSVSEVRLRGWSTPRPPAPLLDPPRSPGPALGFALQLLGVSFLIRFAVGGILFWSALPLVALGHARAAHRERAGLLEPVLLHLLVLGLGVSGIWGFVGHFFMSAEVASSIGWAASPFQQELAFYHLGLGAAGLLCLWFRGGFWLATGIVASVFAYGAGLVHLREFLASGNASPANWGLGVLFGNVLIPTALLACVVAHALRCRPWTADAGS